MTTQVQKLEARVSELERMMDLLTNKFEVTIAKALEKVIGDGLTVESDKELAELLQKTSHNGT